MVCCYICTHRTVANYSTWPQEAVLQSQRQNDVMKQMGNQINQACSSKPEVSKSWPALCQNYPTGFKRVVAVTIHSMLQPSDFTANILRNLNQQPWFVYCPRSLCPLPRNQKWLTRASLWEGKKKNVRATTQNGKPPPPPPRYVGQVILAHWIQPTGCG